MRAKRKEQALGHKNDIICGTPLFHTVHLCFSPAPSCSTRTMATTYSPKVKAHTWISLWFLVTTPIILWDVGFCFMRFVVKISSALLNAGGTHLGRPCYRPRSFKGGDLHWIWKPYALYQNIDLVSDSIRLIQSLKLISAQVYGVETYKRGDGFTNAQCSPFHFDQMSVLNVFIQRSLTLSRRL